MQSIESDTDGMTPKRGHSDIVFALTPKGLLALQPSPRPSSTQGATLDDSGEVLTSSSLVSVESFSALSLKS